MDLWVLGGKRRVAKTTGDSGGWRLCVEACERVWRDVQGGGATGEHAFD